MHNIRSKPGKVGNVSYRGASQENRDGLCVDYVRKQIYMQFWLENPKGRDTLRHLAVRGRIMLK
jgi:hypothetical protein